MIVVKYLKVKKCLVIYSKHLYAWVQWHDTAIWECMGGIRGGGTEQTLVTMLFVPLHLGNSYKKVGGAMIVNHFFLTNAAPIDSKATNTSSHWCFFHIGGTNAYILSS